MPNSKKKKGGKIGEYFEALKGHAKDHANTVGKFFIKKNPARAKEEVKVLSDELSHLKD